MSAIDSLRWVRLDNELILLDPVTWETHLLPVESADLFLELLATAPHDRSDMEAQLDLLSPNMQDSDRNRWMALLERAGAVVCR